MTQYTPLFERARERFVPPEIGLDAMYRRRDRKLRSQRIRAGILALAIVALGAGLFLRLRRAVEEVPTSPAITTENVASLRAVWTASAPGGEQGEANIRPADGMVFVTSHNSPEGPDGALLAFPQDCPATCSPTWRADIGCCESMPDGPLVMDGMVFVAEGQTLLAFDERCATGGATCEPMWRGVVSAAAQYQPVGADGVVYTGSTGGQLYAWDARCGSGDAACSPMWVSASQRNPIKPSVVAGGNVYVGTLPTDSARDHNAVYLFSTSCTDGCRPMKTLLGGDLASSPVLAGDAVVVATYDRTTGEGAAAAFPRSCAFEAQCKATWRGTLPGAANMPDPIVSGGVVFFTSTSDGFVRAFPLACGDPCEPLWTSFAFDPSINEPASTGGLFYLPSEMQGLLIYPVACATHGGVCDPLWTSTDSITRRASGVAVDEGRVFVRTTDGRLIALAPGAAPTGEE